MDVDKLIEHIMELELEKNIYINNMKWGNWFTSRGGGNTGDTPHYNIYEDENSETKYITTNWTL